MLQGPESQLCPDPPLPDDTPTPGTRPSLNLPIFLKIYFNCSLILYV